MLIVRYDGPADVAAASSESPTSDSVTEDSAVQDFRELKVWQKSHALALAMHELSRAFPRAEMFGLTSQLRRAAYSVPSNLAGGCCRGSDREFARFVAIAMGSASEAEYLLLLARDLKLIPNEKYAEMQSRVSEIKRMLSALHGRLSRPGPGSVT